MRRRCPVAYSRFLHYSVFRHADVTRILGDPETFSNRASRHVSVPNSMDPPEHTAWRRMIEPYFDSAAMADFEPTCRRICRNLVEALPRTRGVEWMSALAHPFAVRMQCAFLGWPDQLHEPLGHWIERKNAATLSGSRRAVTTVATEFDATIRAILACRRKPGATPPDDATTRLMNERVNGRAPADREIVSILRNWTVGELGTIASGVGIIAQYLALHPRLQQRLRAEPALVWPANDEILRIQAPLVASRRTPTRPVVLGGRRIEAGERLTLMWASANRDETVFGDPDIFRLDRDPALNLLYGAGIHACPGAPLARLELATLVQTLLASTTAVEPVEGHTPVPAAYPTGGYRELMLRIR